MNSVRGSPRLCDHYGFYLIAEADVECHGVVCYDGGENMEWNYNRIARWWVEKGGIVAVAGSAAEIPAGQEVCAGLPRNRCFNFCGKTGLRELLTLVRFSRFMVCNDSGIMHLGAAVGRPGIALFGSTDPTATGPISPAWQCFASNAECSPCFSRVCPAGDKHCMAELEVESVIGEMEKIFGPGRF